MKVLSSVVLMVLFALPVAAIEPANPKATVECKEILNYLYRLSDNSFNGIISGQNLGQGPVKSQEGYNQLVKKLYYISGEWVGMVGVQYEFIDIFTAQELIATNDILVDYFKAGGLVTIVWTPRGPENSGISPSQHPHVDLNTLLPGGKYRNWWKNTLDRIADALQDLENRGVPVLWRPLQEMNGSHYWYAKVRKDDPTPNGYDKVWQDMFNYFVHDRGLDNLLWVFSPMNATPIWNAGGYDCYPGHAYVDIIGATAHMLRHSFATHMYEAGVTIADIAQMMGHAHRTETTRYIHVTVAAAQRLLNAHTYHTQHYREE